MKNKTIGLILLGMFGVGTLLNFLRVTDFDRITSTLWLGTLVMIGLFGFGMILILEKEKTMR